MTPSPARSRVVLSLGMALVLAPLGLQALAVRLFGVNMLVWDEFYYVDFIRRVRAGKPWLGWLWVQHNEHRVIPMKLAMAPLALATHWNTKAEMYLSVGLAGLVILGLWRLYRHAGGESLFAFAPVAWLACCLSQFQNMLYGMMICHYFTLLGVVWGLVFLAAESPGGLVAAIGCGFLASYSIANGLLIWPVGLLFLLVRGARRSLMVAWTIASLVLGGAYFYRFALAPGTQTAAHDLAGLYRFASYAVTALGAPLGAGSVDWSRAAGLALASAVAAIVWSWQRRGLPALREEAIPAALILFALLSCAMIAFGRVASGTPPLESRYIVYSSLAWMGVYMLAVLWSRRGEPDGRAWLAGALALLLPGLLAAEVFGLRECKGWQILRLRERYLLQTADAQPDEALAGIYFVPEIRRLVPYLRAERLGPFAEPQDLLFLVRWREGESAGEILPDRPLEQTFVCNVDTLYEAGAVLSTFGRKNRSNLAASLWEGDRQLAARPVPLGGLADHSWVSLAPPEPLHGCKGRTLTLRFITADATPGDAASVWTYPSYYPGELRQAGRPILPGRATGLEINAYHFGALD